MTYVLKMEEWKNYHRLLAADFMPTVRVGLQSAGARLIVRLVERTRTAPPANPAGKGTGGAVNTGALARGWKAEPTSAGLRLYNVESYAPIPEYGRRIGAPIPPTPPIARWAQRKLRLSETAALAAAPRIARAISIRGLRPRRILTAEEFQREIEKIAKEEIVLQLQHRARRPK